MDKSDTKTRTKIELGARRELAEVQLPSTSAGATTFPSSHSPPSQLAIKYGELVEIFEHLVSRTVRKQEKRQERNQEPEQELELEQRPYVAKITDISDVSRPLENAQFRLSLWATDISVRSPTQSATAVDVLQIIDDSKSSLANSLNDIFGNIFASLRKILSNLEIDSTTNKEKFHLIGIKIKSLQSDFHDLDGWTEKIRSEYAASVEHHSVSGSLVLCLDGGGVRSFSSLIILRAIMDKINHHPQNVTWASDLNVSKNRSLRPRDYFDFIFGSSTGGLIAIMLGRLKMTVDESIEAFKKLGDDVFRHSRIVHFKCGIPWRSLFYPRSKYGQKPIKKAIQKVVMESESDPSGRMCKTGQLSALEDHCKTGVIALGGGDLGLIPHIFRTYDHPDDKRHNGRVRSPGYADDIPIWLAAMATSAEPPYFDPVNIGHKSFVGAGFGYNNPSLEAIFEVHQMHQLYSKNHKGAGGEKTQKVNNPVDLLVSIGSGIPRPRNFPNKGRLKQTLYYLRASQLALSDTEATHIDVQKLSKMMHSPSSYNRFNVEEGLESLQLHEWVLSGKKSFNKTLEQIEAMTTKYLSKSEVQADLDRCAWKLVQLRRFRK